MSGKTYKGFLRKFLAENSKTSKPRNDRQELPYVQTATRFGIISEPYSAEARERDIAWLEELKKSSQSNQSAT